MLQYELSQLSNRGPDINTLIPEQNDGHFANNISRCIFLTENVCILVCISMKFVSKDPTDERSTMIQAWQVTTFMMIMFIQAIQNA